LDNSRNNPRRSDRPIEQYRDQLDRYQFQMGSSRGRLATALDMMTDTLALIGQHGVYCRSARGTEALDIRRAMDQLEDSKTLILDTMTEMRAGPPPDPD